MDKTRRGFLGRLFLAGAGAITGLEATDGTIKQEEHKLPIVNPRFSQDLKYDEIFSDLRNTVNDPIKCRYHWENDNIIINIQTYSDGTNYKDIFLKKPMGLQNLYSALKDLYHKNADLIKFPFPMMAITPEQFMMEDGWDIDTVLLRNGGIRLSNGKELACITVLSQEGIVTSNGYQIANAGLVPIKDGKLVGEFKKMDDSIGVDLNEIVPEMIGVRTFTYQHYRIV